MEAALWYVLSGTRGGANRARILRALDERPRNANKLAEDGTAVAMVHRDTNDNGQYDFVDEEGAADGPYTYDGEAVVDTAHVSVLSRVTFPDQEGVGDSVTVDSVTLHDGGFVTVHDSTVLDGDVFDSVRGTSEYLGSGTHENVSVQIDEVPGGEDTLVAMSHQGTNGNGAYDFVDEEGAADGPYTAGGAPVTDAAQVTGESGSDDDRMGGDGTGTQDDDATQDDGAGFGAVVALLAIVAVLLVARERS